jgi:hypothetical protein
MGFICYFLKLLHQREIDGLLKLATQKEIEFSPATAFESYVPNAAAIESPRPVCHVEFGSDLAYAIYNWEIFFHAPLLIACKLSLDQRFAEAQRWFHFIFNPTVRSKEPPPKRYWSFLPFHDTNPDDPQNESIQQLMLALDDTSNPAMSERVRGQLREWTDDPFNPHLVARMRPVAYQNTVIMEVH